MAELQSLVSNLKKKYLQEHVINCKKLLYFYPVLLSTLMWCPITKPNVKNEDNCKTYLVINTKV